MYTKIIAEKYDFSGFSRHFPNQNLSKGLEVPWPEVIRFPDKQPNGAKTLNESNYFANQRDLRVGWIKVLLEMKSGNIDTADKFEEQLIPLHRVDLIGQSGDSFYLPRGMRFDIGADSPEKLSKSAKERICKELAHRLWNPEHISRRTFDAIFQQLRVYNSTNFSSLEPLGELCCNLLLSTYCINKTRDHSSIFLFVYGNHSFFMNLVNGLLRLNGYSGVTHGVEDMHHLNKQNYTINESAFREGFYQRLLASNS